MSKSKRIYRTVPPEERCNLIAEAAYFRAERRNFQGGCPIQDWLEAEREIDQLYSQPLSPRGALVFLPPEQSLHRPSLQAATAAAASDEGLIE